MLDGQELIEMRSNQFLGLCKDMGGSKKQIKVIVHNDSVVFHVIWLILQPNGYLFQ